MKASFRAQEWYAVVSICLLAGCGQDAPPPRPATKVAIVTTGLTDYGRTVALTGAVAARVSSELSFRVSGRIRQRDVEIGEHVKAGQILATLEPDQQRATATASEADVQSAAATVAQTAAAFDRQKRLIGPGFTTRRDYDQAEEAFRSAQGKLDVAKAQFGIAQDQLDQTNLRADADGVVTARAGEAGQVVQAAQAVYTLAQDGPRDAVFMVDEAVLAGEPADTTIRLALVADPKVQTTARPREIAPVVDSATGTVRMKFEIMNTPPGMTLGAAVIGTGQLKPQRKVTLPWTALSSKGADPAVWVVDPSTKAVSLRKIEIAAFDTGAIVVQRGLEPGQMVVSRGGQLLHPNQVVIPEQDGKS